MNDQERKAAHNKVWRTNIEAVLAVFLFIAFHALIFYVDRRWFPLFP